MSKTARMTLDQFLGNHDIDRSLLLGYYGGGNFGDELLLEILQNLAHDHTARDIAITYKKPDDFLTYHHDFKYTPVAWKFFPLLKAWVSKKQIIVGGGGLWGLDADKKILVLSFLLFMSRIFGKKVFLLGVGFYDSTPKVGVLAAKLAAKASHIIIARDAESYRNFRRFNPQTYLDRDIAWYVSRLEMEDYIEDLDQLERHLSVRPHTILLGIRHFKTLGANAYTDKAETFIAANKDTPVIAATFESPQTYPEGYRILQSWNDKYENLQITDSRFNPVALFAFMQKYRSQLALVAPQFHAILAAHFHKVPFLPIVYDNKVRELLRFIGIDAAFSIETIETDDIQSFADKSSQEAA